ncbi:Mandelate racemase/muconate lactonizing protein [Chloroherpeton thalassium ATCC 35110]|uniref:o-succinylbenzoate synthase n=1 Tax=Chloroherpeton thalassium (strain ATCC 35110 / GB-78) TaxID=517418 RepID=B3QUT9_CHLT3|nr:o-succinylbenzoate synthase [Chloroherpeton thalassium]ACF14440.1 Mandelate racemase/muconate lactonizing protein [Chloroherpeton thalassium ATCC 35110]
MKISNLRLFRYELPFVKALRMVGREHISRLGLILCLQDDDNHDGFGEIAPLPGLHKESLAQAIIQIRYLAPKLKNAPLKAEFALLDGHLSHWLEPYRLFPSVRIGIEMATLNLLSNATGISLCHMITQSNSLSSYLPLNGLISGTQQEIKVASTELLFEGYRTLKMKVGRQTIEEEADTVRMLRRLFGRDVAIRLDANRSWSFDRAIRFGETISDCNVAYIEEPLMDVSRATIFVRKTGVKIALDETLAEPNAIYREIPIECIGAFVLKPGALGSVEKTVELARYASEYNIPVVLSSAFESGLSLAFYSSLAASLNATETACGLDTYKFFKHDILLSRFKAKKGIVNVPEAYQNSRHLDWTYLEEVPL